MNTVIQQKKWHVKFWQWYEYVNKYSVSNLTGFGLLCAVMAVFFFAMLLPFVGFFFLVGTFVALHFVTMKMAMRETSLREDPTITQGYDLNIQNARKYFFSRRRHLWFTMGICACGFVLVLYSLLTAKPLLDNFIDVRHPIGELPGMYWSIGGIIYGVFLAIFAFSFVFCHFHLFKRFIRFQCPSTKCSKWIDTWKEWVCPYCPPGTGLNDGRKRSFFQKCIHCGKEPDWYQHSIQTCGFVFELIPGGNRFKYAREPWTHFPAVYPEEPKAPEPEPVKVVEEPPLIPHGIPLDERFRHTLIIADTGWGKSWLLKTIAYHDTQAHYSPIIVDSEGGFAMDILSLRDKGDVIYIDFTDPENVPCLSMFDIKLGSTAQERERVFKSTISLYLYVFSSLMSSKLTDNQATMLKFLCTLMMDIPDANFRTLKDVIFDIRPFQGKIRQLGEKMGKIGTDAADYFAKDWHTKAVGEVKQQLMNRLNMILSDSVLSRIFTQSQSKIDLYKAINQGKVIVVNVNRSHLQDACPILGRFFIAMLFQAALRRREGERYKPAFLFIDEAWRYFDENLGEMYETVRKRDLGLVIATQQISRFKDVSMSLRNAAFQSAIKFIGKVTANEDAEAMKELGLDPKFYKANEDLTQVKERVGSNEHLLASEFYCRVGGRRARKVKISFADIQNAPRLRKEELQELLEENNQRYCERVRVRGARVTEGDETVLEPDEHGRLLPSGRVDREDDWDT